MFFSNAVEKFIANFQITNRSPQTVIGYRKELTYFMRFWDGKNNYPPELDEVTDSDIDEYLQYKTNKKLATATIARALNILNSFYNFLCKKRFCNINPAFYVDSIKVIKARRQFLTEIEFEKVLDNTVKVLMKQYFLHFTTLA
ncbi:MULTISPECIES: tyrosine-type recombinase/integrase [Clostridium]|uniref:Site-specific integrase n=1 Tax=Clostridium frigoriphilum TaxID=443253 RepID=A0ABU7UXW2_9CLOT|nr:site-specific integrase [Clostridium sp. DSM 17811]MBU3101787.1 site-specific integrase [Clostridium sp. DSM 17811]